MMYMEFSHLPFLAGHYFENFARSSNSFFFFFGFYLFFQVSYFHSILKVNVESTRNISRLNFCTKWKMVLGTTLDIFIYWCLCCNLFPKAAFMNFMFPEHCRITLLAPKCKTSFVITLNIHFLEKIFLLITTYYLSHKAGIIGFNVPTNLFWNFAKIWGWNTSKILLILKY